MDKDKTSFSLFRDAHLKKKVAEDSDSDGLEFEGFVPQSKEQSLKGELLGVGKTTFGQRFGLTAGVQDLKRKKVD